jgi:hypothetical protein
LQRAKLRLVRGFEHQAGAPVTCIPDHRLISSYAKVDTLFATVFPKTSELISNELK